jgi:hypothetical protein
LKKKKNLAQQIYPEPIYFFNRERETKFIQKRINKKRSISIVAPDGFGKTSLICHFLNQFKVDNRIKIVVIDLIFYSTLRQFLIAYINSLSNLALSVKDLDDSKIGDELQSINETDLLKKLNHILEKINEGRKKLFVVFDNLQQSYLYGTEKFENSVLNPLFKSNDILVVLSGTRKLYSLNESDELYLEKIDENKYQRFLLEILKKNGINFSKKARVRLNKWAGGDISALSIIFERASKLDKKKIREKEVNDTIDQLMIEMNSAYSIIKNLLSPYQWKLLVAIALQDSHYQITSSSFITKYELNAPSSVKTALDALVEKELIFRNEKQYALRNRLLKNWIMYNFHNKD